MMNPRRRFCSLMTPVLFVVSSCSSPGGPTPLRSLEQWKAARTVPISSQPASPATLVIESPSVGVSGPDSRGWFGYGVRFRLRETGGERSAEIGDLLVVGPDSSDWTGPGCWRDSLRVPSGGTLDTFHTDAGLGWLGYCAPGSGGRTATPTLRLIVHFTDDLGREGIVETVITAR